MRKLLCLLLLIATTFGLYAQIRIDTSKSAEQLIREVLLDGESDLIIKNVRFQGLENSIGEFKNETPIDVINHGLILSTGDVFDAIGPNKSRNTGSQASGRGDNDLQAIATGIVLDAVVLEFDLIALRDSIVFEYVFTSEEYPEYVNKGVNDIFGFFLKEKNGRAIFPMNIAKVPNSNKTVTIDNVNHRVNNEYFLRSDFLTAHDAEFWNNNRDLFLRATFFEYDGFTTVLKAVALPKEGKTYHLKIAIADVGDRLYDSAVLLKAQSFRSAGKRIAKADSIVKSMIDEKMKGFSTSYVLNEDLSFSLKINFNTNESIILPQSFEELEQFAALMTEFKDLKAEIIGHTDDVGTTTDNLVLSEKRAIAVKKFLFDRGIDPKRLNTVGKGESEFIESNKTEEGRAENRRVEFKLSY